MRRVVALMLLALGGFPSPGCHHRVSPTPPEPPSGFLAAEEQPVPRVLIIDETEGLGGAAVADSAHALEILIAHFEQGCEIVPASQYEEGSLQSYPFVFYLAGKPQERTRRLFADHLDAYSGTVTWVGPGVEVLGETRLTELGLVPSSPGDPLGGPVEWTIEYGTQRHVEQVYVPPVRAGENARLQSAARRGGERRPFLAGDGRLWYAAAGPALGKQRFWTACIWADALHEILGHPHEDEARRIVPALRDVPVWVTDHQVPDAISPFRKAGIPVVVLAWTQMGEVPLADRPDAARGLRTAESLGATVALASDTGLDALEQFRLAWEVRVHPIAWMGPADGDNPFRLRITGPDLSPPLQAGGLLPAPIAISDAGYISPSDADRLRMQSVVRDAVALVSFGLWAPPKPFLTFLAECKSAGWKVADLRELGVRVTEPRRVMVSGEARVPLPPDMRVRETVLSARWEVQSGLVLPSAGPGRRDHVVSAPQQCVVLLEPERERSASSFVKGVTLDPWAYARSGMSAETLSQTLAERYSQNGVNTVFFYAYNVNEGAAYRTRYSGASISAWGRQDLLAHVLRECHARNIRVVAWMYSGRDKAMWLKHPGWRERTRDGKEHNPLRLHAAYFLCPRNPEVRHWYAKLLQDLARRYPALDGIELCEPVVNWFGNQACYCDVCQQQFAAAHPGEPLAGTAWREFRSRGLTEFLTEAMKVVREHGIDTYVMTISDAWSNGAILSPRRQSEESGFDLEALLDGPNAPDWINFEVIWQQWAAIYGSEVFNYEWTEEVGRRLVRRTDGRARVIFHVELSDFGSQRMTPAKIAQTIERLVPAKPDGIDCYHSGALDRKAGWGTLKAAYEELP
jgi:hypothetical protein